MPVIHAYAGYSLPGEAEPSESRDSMQLYVALHQPDGWRVEAMQNSRQLTMERQLFLDDLDSLTGDQRRQVTELVASLKVQSH